MHESPSEQLLAARRALEGMRGLEIIDDWVWYAQVRRWVLVCRLSLSIPDTSSIPAASNWYVLVEPSYPWGSIKCYPAKEGGIWETFPHQSYNSFGDVALPWRNGDICLDTGVHALGRHGYDSEPYDVRRRLRWRLQRALDWLYAAAEGALVLRGEPFEVPQYPTKHDSGFIVAYTENGETFTQWQDVPERYGIVDISQHSSHAVVVRSFRTHHGRTIWVPSWGTGVTSTVSDMRGIWLRLEQPLALPPWQAPATWGELREACHIQGVDLDAVLQQLASPMRDRKRHVVCIGYPIPERHGNLSSSMHWEALLLPVLASGKQTAHGFRPNETGHYYLDRMTVLNTNVDLEWVKTENWDAQQIATRGRLDHTLISMFIALVGAGALGSIVAELLVRAGCQHLTLIDGDHVSMGNLVRHTLDMEAIGTSKAEAVVERLTMVSPHASLTAINSFFPPIEASDQANVEKCSIVMDCTGSDEVLYQLGHFPWQEPKLFISLSLSLRARRLYCFIAYGDSFPHAAFQGMITPWLRRDLDEHAEEELPREGVGCWHPVFPARYDDIMLMAASAIKHIEQAMAAVPLVPVLTVFEQVDDNGFAGVRRLPTEVGDG